MSQLAALLGSLKSAQGSISEVTGTLGKFRSQFNSVSEGVSGSFAKMRAQLGTVGDIMSGGVTKGLKVVGGAWGELVGQLTGGIAQIRSSVGQFVAAFSPASVMMFDRAVKDLYGSIGENLVPVLKAFREMIRWLGDTVAGMTPTIKPVIERFIRDARPVFEAMGNGLRRLAEATVPYLELLSRNVSLLMDAVTPAYEEWYDLLSAVGELLVALSQISLEGWKPLIPIFADQMRVVAFSLRLVTDSVREFVNMVRAMGGLAPPKAIDFKDKGVGKGVTDVSWVTSDEMWRKAMEAGMRAGNETEIKDDPVGGIAADVNELVGYFRNWKAKIEEFLNNPVRAAGDAAGMIANAAGNQAVSSMVQMQHMLRSWLNSMGLKSAT